MFTEILALMGMPRSGTSWLSQIFDSSPDVRFRLSPLFSYQFKNRLNEESIHEEWLNVLQGAYSSENEFMSQSHRRRDRQYPTFAQKAEKPRLLVLKDTRFHNLSPRLLELFENSRIVAIVRHPCGAIHSWLNAPREFPKVADPIAEWRNGSCRKTGYGEFWGFEDWKWTTRLYMELQRKFAERCLVVRYENLVREPMVGARRMFQFAGIEMTQQTVQFLHDCHSRHDVSEYAVFKDPAVAEAWRSRLQPEIRMAIESELAGTDMEEFLA